MPLSTQMQSLIGHLHPFIFQKLSIYISMDVYALCNSIYKVIIVILNHKYAQFVLKGPNKVAVNNL